MTNLGIYRKRCVCPKCGEWKYRDSKTCHACYLNTLNQNATRQREVTIAVANGLCLKETAVHLGISNKTVEYHWAKARAKFNLHSVADAVRFAIIRGWTTLELQESPMTKPLDKVEPSLYHPASKPERGERNNKRGMKGAIIRY